MRQNKLMAILKKPYTIYLLILMALVLVVWIYLWSGLASYEAGIPQNLMNTVLKEIQQEAGNNGDCKRLLLKYGYASDFGSVESDGIALAETVADKELSYKKKTGWDGIGEAAYSVTADGKEVAVVVLSEQKSKGIMGLSLYEISGVLGTTDLTILAHPDTTIYVGGVEIDKTEPRSTAVIPEDLEELAEYAPNEIEIPTYSEYVIQGLFSTPQITATLSDGREAETVFIEDSYVMISEPASDALLAEVSDRIMAITQKYSYYMSDDLGWSGFKGYLVKTSPIYDRLGTLEVHWYTLHDSTSFENMVIDNFFVFSENLISVRLTYDYVVVGQGKVTTYPTDLTYYLATDIDGKWRVAEMIVN